MKESYKDHYRNIRQQASVIEQQAELLSRMSETLSAGREFSVRVTDSTLEPFIVPGDMMIFLITNFEKIGVGDFVLYRLNNGAPAVRRVVKKGIIEGHAQLYARSDATPDKLDLVRASQVLAKMICVERYDKRIPASRLNRGLLDWITGYGMFNPFLRLIELCFIFLPSRARPHLQKIRGHVTRIEAPTLDRKKDQERREKMEPAKTST